MTLIGKLKRSSLARDTGHLAIGQSLRLVIQAAYFVLIARTLGPERYGAFAAAVALAGVLAPFSGLGTSNLFVKNVRALKRDAAECWGNGIVATLASGAVLSTLVFAIVFLFRLDMPMWLVASVCISDLFLMRVIELAVFGFMAMDRMAESAAQNVATSLPRLIAIAALMLIHRPVTVESWASAYLAATAAGTLYAIYRGQRIWGYPRFRLASIREDFAQGTFFSIGTSAATIYNDIDKVMLGKISFASAGIYAAAYRVIDVSIIPIRSLANAAYPRFFRKGVDGLAPARAFAYQQIRRASLYSAALFVALWLAAPLLPLILGESYTQTALALRWLAFLPLLRGVHVFLADSLSGAGFQGLRSGIQVSIAIVNVGLNLAILPRWGWLGAAWTSLASDGLLVVVLWLAIQYKLRAACQPAVSVMSA